VVGTAEQKRAHYRRKRGKILAQQGTYRRRVAGRPAVRARNGRLSRAYELRFQAAMLAAGYPGTGHGLSTTAYRYREAKGLPVPPWPQLVDATKARRGTSSSVRPTVKKEIRSRRNP
jgi:hypothetical protein